MSYNGEIYNTNHVRDRFGLAQFEFRGHSDTEVLIEAIAVAGVEAVVRELDAMFAFAAWDSVEERLWLARDRFGEKPLYFSASQDRVMFASEPRALLPLFDTSLQIDATGLSDLVRYGQVTGSHSIYTGCRRVRPGQILSFGRDPHDDREVRYWIPAQAARTAKSSPRAPAADEVERVLAKSVERRMVSDVPLGAFLSGGVDSSLVVALMQKHSDRPVKTFTIGFGDRQYNEAGWAARVAEHLGTDHTEWIMSEDDVLDVIPRLPRIYDEPFADSSQIPTYLVSHLARQHVTVALSGDGGDELFGGYERYKVAQKLDRLMSSSLRTPIRMLGRVAGKISVDRWNSLTRGPARHVLPVQFRQRLGERAHKFVKLSEAGADSYYDRMMSTNVDAGRFLSIRPMTDLPAYRLDEIEFESVVERAMLADTAVYLPDDILTKVDRASMANSLEVRVPMLSPEVFDVAWRLPLDQKISGGEGKVVLRQILKRHLPADLVDRPKMGFGVPLAEWLRGPLRDWADDLLSSDALDHREVWKTNAVRQAWTSHRSGRSDQSVELWPVLMFQAWADEWLQ